MSAPLPAPGVPPELFRQLLGRFATGVAVLTARDAAGRPMGMTASAVASASLVPPLVLVCVDRARDLHPVLERAPYFGLTVLAADQEPLSRRFADETVSVDRFAGVAVADGAHGVPLIGGGVAQLVCARHAVVPAGDHTIFLGQVVAGGAAERAPLLYFRGSYRGLDGDAHG